MYRRQDGEEYSYNANFEGVIPNLIRRHKETNSEFIRAEIEKFMVRDPCPLCKGSRLKKEVLSVVIDKKNIWNRLKRMRERLFLKRRF